MKIQYISDIHLEFKENYLHFLNHKIKPVGEVLILAGDIILFNLLAKDQYIYSEFFDFLSNNFKAVYWLPGNHEYYHYELTQKYGPFKESIRKNVFLLNNQVEYLDNGRIIFSTLWSQIEQLYEKYMERNMADFHLIRYNGVPITSRQYNKMFEDNLSFIKQEVNKPFTGKTIIVSHHVPTLKNYPTEFAGSPLNNGFVTDLTEFICESKIDYWIYGHHHRNIPDFKIGETVLTTNQLGYIQYNESKGLDTQKHIDW